MDNELKVLSYILQYCDLTEFDSKYEAIGDIFLCADVLSHLKYKKSLLDKSISTDELVDIAYTAVKSGDTTKYEEHIKVLKQLSKITPTLTRFKELFGYAYGTSNSSLKVIEFRKLFNNAWSDYIEENEGDYVLLCGATPTQDIQYIDPDTGHTAKVLKTTDYFYELRIYKDRAVFYNEGTEMDEDDEYYSYPIIDSVIPLENFYV